jgi:uncharacterized membrane protein
VKVIASQLKLFLNTRLRSRFQTWSVPAAYIVLALLLANLLPLVDRQIDFSFPWLLNGTAGSVLSTISSGMISFTGFIFSLVFVFIQFGSSNYTPRLAGYLLQDPIVRHSLGVFSGTFLFSLLSLFYIDLYPAGRVPDLTTGLAFLMVLVSSLMFLALIERVTSLRVNSVLHMVGTRGRQVIERMYPLHFHTGENEDLTDHQSMMEQLTFPLPPITQTLTYHGSPMVIKEYQQAHLLELARWAGAIIEYRYPPGDTIPDGSVLFNIRGAQRTIPKQALKAAVTLGHERTIEQDPKYAIRLIVDIAIRALSPAVNDPTTAVQALDELSDLLHRIGTRKLDVGLLRDRQGKIRLIYPTPDWEDYLTLAVDEIRQYGATSIQIMRRLQALLKDLLEVLPEERARLVRTYHERICEAILRTFPDQKDQLSALMADRQGIGLSRPVGSKLEANQDQIMEEKAS